MARSKVLSAGTIVELARSSATVGVFQQALLAELMRHVGADVGAFAVGRIGSPATNGFRADVVGEWVAVQSRHAAELRPVLAAAYAGAAVDAEVLGERRARCSRYFSEIVRPHGGRETLCAVPVWGAAPVACLWLGRCGPLGRFRRRDILAVIALLPAIAMAAVAMPAKDLRPDGATLSAREREIVDLLRLGLRSREIAGALGTSLNTVRNQIWRLMARVGAGTRAELIAHFASEG